MKKLSALLLLALLGAGCGSLSATRPSPAVQPVESQAQTNISPNHVDPPKPLVPQNDSVKPSVTPVK